jgi:peroxiredoxin
MRGILALLMVCGIVSAVSAESPPPVGVRMGEFTLPDAAGKAWNLTDLPRERKGTVVAFLAVSCPVSQGNLPKLADMHKRYTADGMNFVAIFSHPADSAEDVAKYAKANRVPFACLIDADGKVANKFHVDRVPTVFVLDSGNHVRYMGRVDDQFAPSVHKPSATTAELRNAILAVVDGRPVTKEYVAPAGCKLDAETKTVTTTLTYHQEISRLIQAKCQTCHRPGEAAPFPLMTYRDAKSWAGMMREVVADNVMPPWHATQKIGHFVNDRRLTDDEKKTLITWIDAGCPEGDIKNTPPAKTYTTGWRLPQTPDKIVKMVKPVAIPSQFMMGAVGMPYQYILGDTEFTTDTWVSAMEVRPDFREVLHHVIVYVIPKGKKLKQLVEDDNFSRHLLAAYVPGDDAVVYPDNHAKKIPAGAKLLFELHYTPNGKAGVDQSSIGLVLAKSPPKWEVKSDAAITQDLDIPPGAANYSPDIAKLPFDEPITLLSMTPHMHVRGKAYRYELVSSSGEREELLNVPNYDFNWQVAYMLKTARTIPAGSRIECKAIYDNSSANPFNPNPKRRVAWGNQTWEEMMIGFVEYVVERK